MNFGVDGFSFNSVFKSVSKATDNIVKSAANFSGSYSHVTNPKLPYVGALPTKACSGTSIVVRGITEPSGDFAINLQCGPSDREDIAFHFNVRGSQKIVVRNSRLGGGWGNEEREGGYPFKGNSLFELEFIISRKNIKVKVDHSSFCDFTHRLDVKKITTLAITGEVDIHYIGFHHSPTFDGSDSDHDLELSDSHLIAGKLSYQHEPKGDYPQPAGSQQQPAGGYPQPAGSQQQPTGGYPQPAGRLQCPEGTYPQSAGSQQQQTVGYPQVPYPAGAYSQPHGNPQQSTIGYPQALGNQPYPAGSYPQSAGNPQQPTGAYPQPTGSPQQSVGGHQQAAGYQQHPVGVYPQPVGVHGQQQASQSPKCENLLPNPLNMIIPGEMTVGRIVSIGGTPRTGCKRFTINLKCEKTAIKDTAFHFDVRMQFQGHSNQVIRNSCIRGRWGSEEKHAPYFPFQVNANFDIMILSEHDMFKVAVNHQHFTEFSHRIQELSRINMINISGDVHLTKICFQ